MYQILNVSDFPRGLAECIQYIHSKWGSEENFSYFENAIINSDANGCSIPQFYVLVSHDEIVGCFGLIANDFVSRHDLYPWFSSLFIEPDHRGRKLSKLMLNHAVEVVRTMGLPSLYLTTTHDNFYEKFGWDRLEDAYTVSGESTRVYRKLLAHA